MATTYHLISLSKKAAQIAAIVGISTTIASPTLAAIAATEWGSVRSMTAGWVVDSMAVFHSAPVVNPDGCPVTTAGYATNPADTGRSLFHTLLLSAFMNRKEVQLLISGCAYSKPRIIAVSVR
ncbi:MAG: hypothetical protein KME17_20760 [Cyanosarcina radialis HA8281-LM2]|jgi:hypothetical protein|nr:hypothetical protein [Cyanosarcina radialis HA8281-LM2]